MEQRSLGTKCNNELKDSPVIALGWGKKSVEGEVESAS